MRTPRSLVAASFACLLAACSPGGEDTGGPGGGTGAEGGGNTGGAGGAGGASTGEGGDGGTGGSAAGGGGNGGAGGTTTGGGGAGGGAGKDWGPDQCPAPPEGVTVGIEVGQQLPDFVVKSCDGQDYSLSELCGAEGLFLLAVHGWCPLCQNISSKAEAMHDAFAAQGLASAIIVVETGSSQTPTAGYCEIWREQFGLEDVVTLYDPTGDILELWPGFSSSLSAFVDQDRVIVSKLIHEGNVDTIESHIQEALDH